MRIIGAWKCKSDLLSLRIFLIFRIFFCLNRNRMHLLVYIHSSALALAHTLGFLNEKLILGRKITLIFYVPWSVKMRLIHLDPPKISESAFLCQKYPPKANSSSSFFFNYFLYWYFDKNCCCSFFMGESETSGKNSS